MPGGISRVRSEDHRSPTSELFGDFVDVDVVFVCCRKRAGNCDELVRDMLAACFIRPEDVWSFRNGKNGRS
jgi:hypothetical protein